jgi:transposase-like protein
MAISFKGAHFPHDIILMGVRWYVAYPLSTRYVEELMGSVSKVGSCPCSLRLNNRWC